METVDLEWLRVEPALPVPSGIAQIVDKDKNVNAVNGSYMLQTI